ncbi:hypothetical protein GCM10025862_42180 [Arsenicicoccus piscis]|uniref:Schlafen group 3-like DNA/RNA helicase domain-containing protein n=1 Tax=Arsenicicoccus piscis TaxID=673954 RepID=A0ABQ6HWU7_9MICO|nr:hypothetical protein GCM10025862_35530 [Arsenicicoccus piscis]GMA22148.1 hypothetical protein GCM10025862_41710 [Arsenicicoccus piscis]GMA22195.1 hypothetical protein GCM10025862_42180 [Arsenicicoccus piscis]
MGPDLVWRTDRWVTDRAGSKDPKLKSRQISDVGFDRLVRNVYKVLFTRGMRGLGIYSTDTETREYLAALV